MTNNPFATGLQWKEKGINYLIDHGGAILSGILIFCVGLFVAGWLAKLILRGLEKKQLEPPVLMLIGRIIRLLVTAFAAMIALETCGVSITALVAGIGVAGIGIGLAMQGVLSNIVAGLTIIFVKPFRVGEYIELLSVSGQVTQIELFSTTLIHGDHSRIVIPNRKIVGEILHNYGNVRQLNLQVGVGYGTDLNKMQSVLREILNANSRVLKEHTPVIGISTLADSSIVVSIQPWTKLADYAPAQAELNTAIIEKFRSNKIEIPFPQQEVRFLNNQNIA